MKKLGLAFVVFATMGSAMSIAQAAAAALSGELGAAAHRLNVVEQVQFFIGDQEYCWYDNGWNGPGWYYCGYAFNHGFGWGGRIGWHDWDRHHPPHRPVHGPGSSHNPTSPPHPISVPSQNGTHGPIQPGKPPRTVKHPPKGGPSNNGVPSGSNKP